MATNKIVLKDVDQFMADFTPTYAPLFSLFLSEDSQGYSSDVGSVSFRRLTTVGDVEGKHYGPKETEIKQISVGESRKVFNKYFFGREYVQSTLQDPTGNEDVIKQVLEAQTKHQDKIFCFGEGTTNGNVKNNALFLSSDPNWISDSAANQFNSLALLHADVMAQYENVETMEGRKHILFYGPDIRKAFNGVYSASNQAFKKVLGDVLDGEATMSIVPSEIENTANGFFILNLDQIKMHYTILPQLWKQGVDERASESWHQFLYGSTMLEVLREGALIKRVVDWQ